MGPRKEEEKKQQTSDIHARAFKIDFMIAKWFRCCLYKKKTVGSHCHCFSCNCIDADDASDVSLKVLSFMEHKIEMRARAAEILFYIYV